MNFVNLCFKGSTDSINEKDTTTGRSTPRLTPPKKESQGVPYRSIRFGFRQGNTVRPASVGLNPRVAHYESVSNNNVVGRLKIVRKLYKSLKSSLDSEL